ncbi:MAG: hypothetical protein NTV01_18470 [Bacteroidia bacterium]|nr:hypothetical protein [Bacteroidia bacterium]
MKTTRISTSLAALLILAAGMALQAQSPARLAEMGQVKRAKQAYLKMYNSGQTNEPDLYYNLGKLYLNTDQPDSAALFFRKGTQLDQKNPVNWIGLARYYYQADDSVKAKANLKTATQVARNNQNYALAMAEMYMQPKPGRPDLAEQFIDKALAQKSNNPGAHILKGDHLLNNGAAGEAANEYKQAMYYDKHNPVTYYKAGIVYAKGRIYQEAINSMQKAIACDSGFIPAYRELGEIYLLFDKYKLAREAYDKYMSLIEPDTRDLIRYGSILVLDRDFESALRIINKLKENNIQDPKVLRIQAYTDYETGHYDTGLAEIRAFFDKAGPGEPMAADYEYYAQLLKKNNLDSLAIPQYLKAIEVDSTRKVLYEEVAKTCEKVRNYPGAAHYYEMNLVNKEPTQVDYFKIGRLYYLTTSNKITADSILRASYIDQASQNFGKVCEMSPTNHLGWFWEARTQALKDPESSAGLAKPFYEKALTIMESSPEKFKKEITEALKYLGYYHYLRFEQASLQAKKEEIPVFRDSSSLYWNRIIVIDPADKQATDALTVLKKK